MFVLSKYGKRAIYEHFENEFTSGCRKSADDAGKMDEYYVN